MRKPLALCKPFAAAALASALCLGLLALAGCAANAGSNASSSSSASSAESVVAPDQDLLSGTHHAVIEVEGYDPINVTLNADEAPITVTNFANLADDGYYNGLTFYRIEDGFCLQGGTVGNSPSGSDPLLQPIKGEFSGNGVSNALADDFGVGTIAMARTSDPDSATSTFFITLGDNASVGKALDGQYAAFGTIDAAGMQTVNAIVSDYKAKATGQMGTIASEADQPKIASIYMVD